MTATRQAPAMVCACARCRAHAAGLGPGPYSPAQYALIAPPTVAPSNGDLHVGDDRAVIAATRARDEARVAFDACDEVWLRAVAEHQAALLLGNDPYLRDPDGAIVGRRTRPRADRRRIAELAEAAKEAAERRQRTWAQVVKANDKIVAAQFRARLVAAEAARKVRSGNMERR